MLSLRPSDIEVRLETIAKRNFPPSLARVTKLSLAYPRYLIQLLISFWGFIRFASNYSQNILFIAGLPKSGTTWLEGMLTQYPGFARIHLPKITIDEEKMGGSHRFQLADDMFSILTRALCVVKTHSHGSENNAQVLNRRGLKYVIMYRDLRDVAISYYFFVRERPWHPEFKIYKDVSIKDGLSIFGKTLLDDYAKWIRDWRVNRDMDLSIEVCYEDMLAYPLTEFTRVAKHFDLPCLKKDVEVIVNEYNFKHKKQKLQIKKASTHFRKGVSGGWRSHFSPALKEMYKRRIGEYLIEFGYEHNTNW